MESYKRFAQIYDELVNEDIDYESWAKEIMDIAEELNIKKTNYLDLACGTGNITELVAPFFSETWAVDLSDDMLIVADEKLRGKKIKAKCVLQDMRQLNLNRRFNLITCCLDSLNYLTDVDDIRQCFRAVRNHLSDDGAFIFDMNSYYKLINILGNNTFTFTNDEVAYIWENYCEKDIVEMYLTFFIQSGELYERFEEEHRERAYKEEFIETTLMECGLKLIMKMDNYEAYEIKDTTERCCYVVKKA